jgi:hypothetical protein
MLKWIAAHCELLDYRKLGEELTQVLLNMRSILTTTCDWIVTQLHCLQRLKLHGN